MTHTTLRNQPIAGLWHTGLVLAALAINGCLGFIRSNQLRQSAAPNRPTAYLRTILIEWLILALVLTGVWLHKSPLCTVLGERWRSPAQFLRDLGIALVFLILSIFITSVFGHHAQHGATDPAVKFLMPETANEKWLWALLAISAGICEEAVYRGYLQQQFSAYTRSLPAGILISAVCFGAGHAYQGTRLAVLIGFGAILSGILAGWRKSVRPGMIAHALQDLLAIFVSH
jgi:membrane protease YdiL (CAAX protease family)